MRPIGSVSLVQPFQLATHQLAQVLCQIRFSPVLRIGQDDAVIPFQEAIRHVYPRYAKQQGMSVLITPQGVTQQPGAGVQHRFEDSEGVFAATLSSEFLALETKQYGDIDDFVGRLVSLAENVRNHFAPTEIHRVGLRFINELRLTSPNPRDEMREAIASWVLGPIGSDELVDVVVGAQQILELAGDDSRMLVRHGLNLQGGTTVDQVVLQAQPLPELAQPFYLLDIDAYRDRIVKYSVEGIEATLRDFNDDVRSLFAWAVREDYRRNKLGQT